jgi:hypothetical protein
MVLSKSKKITKKDLKMMLIGKIVSFGVGTVDTETASQIFETITGIHLTKYIEKKCIEQCFILSNIRLNHIFCTFV